MTGRIGLRRAGYAGYTMICPILGRSSGLRVCVDWGICLRYIRFALVSLPRVTITAASPVRGALGTWPVPEGGACPVFGLNWGSCIDDWLGCPGARP